MCVLVMVFPDCLHLLMRLSDATTGARLTPCTLRVCVCACTRSRVSY